jgi:2'-5' RNA ligase
MSAPQTSLVRHGFVPRQCHPRDAVPAFAMPAAPADVSPVSTRTGMTGPGMTDHWGPLEGWTPERELLACYLTFAEQPALHALVDAYARPVKDLAGLDPVPVEWLHTTLQGIAFTDQLPVQAGDDLARALTPVLAQAGPLRIRTGQPFLGQQGAYLRLGPARALARLRDLIREAACTVLGLAEPYDLPGQNHGFDPHITFAYANRAVPAALVWDRLRDVSHDRLELEITALSLVTLRRDAQERRWYWTTCRQLAMGG